MTLLISPLQGEATVVSNPPALAPQVLRFQAQDTSDLHLTSFVWFRLFFLFIYFHPLYPLLHYWKSKSVPCAH